MKNGKHGLVQTEDDKNVKNEQQKVKRKINEHSKTDLTQKSSQ